MFRNVDNKMKKIARKISYRYLNRKGKPKAKKNVSFDQVWEELNFHVELTSPIN